MLFWKKVEIYCGYSLKEFTELRDALAVKNIPYDYKIVNLFERSKRSGHIRLNPDYNEMYYLYVHLKDYDKAMFCTSNRHLHQ